MLYKQFVRACATLARALLVLVLAVVATAHADQTVRVAIYHNPPLLDYDDPQQPRGISIDVLNSAASANGWTLTFVPGTFAEGSLRTQRGEVDLMPNLALTAQRRLLFRFNREPVLHTWGQVYARKDSGIRSILDLSGKRVVGVRGTLQMDYFAQTAEKFGVRPVLTAVADYDVAAREVQAGRADALVANPFTGARLERDAGLLDTAIMFEPYTQFFGGPRGRDSSVLDAIDAHLLQLKADPSSVYFASLQQLTETQRKERLPPWVAWAAAAAAAMGAVGLAWTRTIKRAAARIAAAELSQRRTAEALSRVTENSPDVIAVLDERLDISRISQAAERLWGYQRLELEGRSSLRVVPEQLREACRAALTEVIASGGVRRTESVAIRKDGTEARMHWSLVWSPQARELYAIGRDDTERKDLIRRLHARGAELARANKDLRTFAQTVSHDLRAPLAAVVGFVGKVLRDDGHTLPDRSRELLTRAHVASQRMDTIIANLLRLARVTEAGVHRRACDVTAMCLDVVTALRNEDPDRSVQVDIQPGMHADADRELLRHVFDNLLANAWKFTSGKPRAHISVGCEESMHGRAYFVRDDGAGFDMEYAHNLFRPFSRLHSDSQFQGVGIGLCVAHRVVAAHGGKIWARASAGAGAVFWFTLGDEAENPEGAARLDSCEPVGAPAPAVADVAMPAGARPVPSPGAAT